MDHTYECSMCDRSLISSFYLCSNCHICCFRCYTSTKNTACQICGLRQVAGFSVSHTNCMKCKRKFPQGSSPSSERFCACTATFCDEETRLRLRRPVLNLENCPCELTSKNFALGDVYCCEFSKYALERANGLLFRRSSGPVVVLPTSQESMKIRRMSDICEDHPCKKLIKCLDCQKCVFSSRVLEHYVCEHKTTLVCPVPPGSMVTFRLRPQDFLEGRSRKLHVFQLMDLSDESSCSEGPASDGDEKLFFLMGIKIPFFGEDSKPNFIVKMWVLATFHACNANYSLEVTGCRENTVSVMFTGVPLENGFHDQPDVSGQVVHIRESLLEHLDNNGGCTLSFYVHGDTIG